MFFSLSSTISITLIVCPYACGVIGPFGRYAAPWLAVGDRTAGFFGMVNVNVEPLPGSLSSQMRPPCNSTNLRVSASPRPVPSCLFV